MSPEKEPEGTHLVCDAAQETCPSFPRPVARLHVSFVDPASASGSEEERMAVFRRVRDEIEQRLLPRLAEQIKGRESDPARRERSAKA